MAEISLSLEEKIALEIKHKKSKDIKECYRINAVLLRAEVWTIAMMVQALRIHYNTVSRHLEDYSKGKLTIARGGSSSILDEAQTKELIM